ncbi:hypothetical protein [Haloarcula sp. JP-L23]|uniref:hypothetical protein n=1 Tax=Haloarcula sp. JP-L23 TaxID=2716717 RepID=UPI00140ED755|nr:hypothetical protein G9465_13745 [Haloarcula sp. JP-L23]
MDLGRPAILVLVIGLLCIPAPLYLPVAIEMTHSQTDAPYNGPVVDPATEDGQETILVYYDRTLRLEVAADLSTERYDAPSRLRRTLVRAIQNGTATRSAPAVRSDIQAVARNYTYLRYQNEYYAFTVAAGGGTVETTHVTREQVVTETVDRQAVAYESLGPQTQRTVDRIVANTSGDAGIGSYRPHENSAVVERSPILVSKNGTLYSIHRDGGTYFGAGFVGFLYGIPVAVVGVLLCIAVVLGHLLFGRDTESRTDHDSQ